MSTLVAITAGALASFVWSFLLAAAILRLRHWRNGWLLARGGLPFKDCVFPRAVWFMATSLGVIANVVVVVFVGSAPAVVAAASLVPPSCLASLPLLAVAAQLRSPRA